MQELNLIDCFNKAAAQSVLIATYEFNPEFFERRLLVLRGFETASRIVVFMDASCYTELLRGGLAAAPGFNQRYLVIPVRWRPGVFHPKLYLLLGKKDSTFMVASANCTSPGIAYNLELCNVVRLTGQADQDDPEQAATVRHVIQTGYELFRSFTQYADLLAEPLEEEVFQPIEIEFPWLDRRIRHIGSPSEVELLHTLHNGLWPQICQRLGRQEIQRITILSPFYDRDPSLFARLRHHWPTANVSVYAQPEYANLPATTVHAWARENGLKVAFHALQPKPGRSVHAKALAFETAAETCWLVGSANFTSAALDGKNFETCLWFRTEECVHELFQHDEIRVEGIKPEDFVPGDRAAPEVKPGFGEKGLALISAILSPRSTLTVQCELPRGRVCHDVTLLITNTDEASPCLSYKLTIQGEQSVKVQIKESQKSLIRRAAVCCLTASVEGQFITSPPVAFVQLGQLFRERGESGSLANRLRHIEETGEGLVEYLDSQEDITEAIHFLQQCSIRFDDGEQARGFLGKGNWRPRNPFNRKAPDLWGDGIDGETEEHLRQAIWDFVERHQRHKLARHRKRGNLNGLSNYFDIFRTLNALLCAWNVRVSKEGQPIISYPFVTKGIKKNLYEFLGVPPHSAYGGDVHEGYLGAIQTNLPGAETLICTKLKEERVPEMLVAALQITQKARTQNSDTPFEDWPLLFPDDVGWLRYKLSTVGLIMPNAESVAEAASEYEPLHGLAA